MIPSPSYLTADWRYARDDWQGANALTYTVYSVQPSFNPDGSVATAGTPMNLAGYAVTGEIYYRPVPFVQDGRYQQATRVAPLPGVVGAVLSAAQGTITLSVPRTSTVVDRQSIQCWSNPDASKLIARPQIVDGAGNVVTVGLQPLFVF